jgi:hypothetical protein
MAQRALPFVQLDSIFERRDDARHPHRMGRNAMPEPEMSDALLLHQLHEVEVQLSTGQLWISVHANWPQEWSR